jgi:two-component system, OmpR family, sensor kinase
VSALGRLPIRVRLALAFALAMAAVLTALGVVLYVRLGSSLDEGIDEGLEARLADASLLVRRGESPQVTAIDPEERFVQVFDGAGRVVATTPGIGVGAIFGASERARIEPGSVLRVERRKVAGVEAVGARLFATAVDGPSGRRFVVVGSSLEDRDDALRGLLAQLLVVGPAALLLTSLLGYAIAAAALRPVESIRAEAAAISAAEPGRRLPVPPTRDEIARLAWTLNGMLERLESAFRRERGFIADASHELRTPLALLQAELELALRRPRSTEELELALRSAAAATNRLARLAEDLLVLARSDQGRLPLRRARVPVAEVVESVVDRFATSAEASGRTIEVDVADQLAVSADALRLEQALGNLVANALEHGEGAIRLSANSIDGRIELHVLDEGPGFPPSFVGRAFERFSSADEARSGGGAGLGLAIVKAIATAHGGFAEAANVPGRGADVWLSIPSEPGADRSAVTR